MNAQHDMQLRLRRHLTEQADPSVAHGQLDAVLAITSTTSQRAGWLAAARLAGRGVAIGIPRLSRETLVLVGTAVIVGLLAVAYVLGQHPQPRPPFKGLILFGRFEEAAGDTVVYTIHPDGTGRRQVTPEPAEEPHWSHDGQRILLGDRIVSPTGQLLQRWQLGSGTFHVQCPHWSPDETRLLCEGFDENVQADAAVHGIYTVRASDAGDLRRLTAPGTAGTIAGYSPDGSTILFYSADETNSGPIYLMDADGGNVRRLGTLSVNSVSWAPDGRSVLATSRASLYRVDVATGSAERITIASIPSAQILGAVWSPDQTQILFKRLTSAFDLYVMNADGSGLRQITSDANEDRFIDWGTHPLDP